jgi:histidine triad (HIT) family protein
MQSDNCIFCKIVDKEVPSKIIYENDDTLAFLDIFPISEGHSIVIPKKHYENIEVIPEEELIKTIKTVKKLAKILHDKLSFEGYNILQNNFKAAGQVVKHFHIHIIPRNFNDSRFRLAIPREQAKNEDLDRIMRKIKA